MWGKILCYFGLHDWTRGKWKLWCMRDGCFAEQEIEEDEVDEL
jgi:hypothetical protein